MVVHKEQSELTPDNTRWIRLADQVPPEKPTASSLEIRQNDDNMIPLQNIRVLVAEDDPFNQALIQSLLRIWKVQVDLAANGAEAISRLKRQAYDLVMMDLEMPVLNGFEATRIIRGELMLRLPVIAVTANSHPTDRQKAFDAGVDDFLAKPFGHAELKRKILQNLNPEPFPDTHRREVSAQVS